jgi:hypothetical protein
MANGKKRNGAHSGKTVLALMGKNISLIRGYGVHRIGVFGSYVNGRPRPRSDVDILVEFEPGRKTFDNYMDLLFFLEKLFRRKVDLVIAEAVKPDLRPGIFGSVVYAS